MKSLKIVNQREGRKKDRTNGKKIQAGSFKSHHINNNIKCKLL